MTEPLGQSQVLPYVLGLARIGWQIDIICFEPASSPITEVEQVRAVLSAAGVGYLWTRRSSSHSVTAKCAESLLALLNLLRRSRACRSWIIHARSYLPAAVADAACAILPDARFIFDCRGLLADEYADAGHWSPQSFRYRLTKGLERMLFRRAQGVVVLTERLRQWLKETERLVRDDQPIDVIPCCVDMNRFRFEEQARNRARAALGAGERQVIVYSGTLGSWYGERELVALFQRLRKLRPSILAVLTRSPTENLRRLVFAAGIPQNELQVCRVPASQMPEMLCGADAAVSFIRPCFSKIASSPTKVAEYMAVGLPIFINRGIGDCDELFQGPGSFDAGDMSGVALDRAVARFSSLTWGTRERESVRTAALERFSLDAVGIPRYRLLYERLAG